MQAIIIHAENSRTPPDKRPGERRGPPDKRPGERRGPPDKRPGERSGPPQPPQDGSH